MMSMMRARRILPLLLPMLALLAVLVYWQPSPAAAQGADPLPAPTVTLTSASACNSENPRTHLVTSYTAVTGAEYYQYRVKWSRAGRWTEWARVLADKPPLDKPDGRHWALSLSRFIAPGETYAVEFRAVDGDGNKGVAGRAYYTLPLSEFPAPTQVAVAYTNATSTEARLTWQGDARSADWFSVRQRAVGQKWESGSWKEASRVGDKNSPYYRDVTGLNPARGYQFRVTGYTGQCGAGSWSDTVSLWPPPVASGFGEVHQADGRWRHQDDGPISAKVSAKGNITVRWTDWIGFVEVDPGEGQEPEVRQVEDWRITLTKPGGKVIPRSTGSGVQRTVTFKGLPIGQDYGVVIAGFDEDGEQLGIAQSATIQSRHVSAPQDITGLTLSVGADNLSVTANWTAPAAGGTPKRYVVYLTNLDSGRTRWQGVEARHRAGGWKPPQTAAAFDGLWPGDRYRVSVQARNRNTQLKQSEDWGIRWDGDSWKDGWQRSGWVSVTVPMPSGSTPSYSKQAPTWIYTPVAAGQPTPPYALSAATNYVVLDGTAPGGLAKFDFPNKCREYEDHYLHINDDGNADNPARLAAHKARRDAKWQNFRLNGDDTLDGEGKRVNRGERGVLADLISAKDEATDDEERKRLEHRIQNQQKKVAAMEARLVTMVADVSTKCAAAYPAVETLTEADARFYQVAQTQEPA